MFKNSRNPGFRKARTHASRSERIVTSKAASISLDGHATAFDATIRDMSIGGARVSFMGHLSVGEQVLVCSRAEGLLSLALVRWRRGNEAGLQFIRRVGEERETWLRDVQAKHFAEIGAAQRDSAKQADRPTVVTTEKQLSLPAAARILGLVAVDGLEASTLKMAYRTAAMAVHPDRGGDAVAFQKVKNAYAVLVEHYCRDAGEVSADVELTTETEPVVVQTRA